LTLAGSHCGTMREDLSSGPTPSSPLRAQPFWLLRVTPAATRQQIEDAFEAAKENQSASEHELVQARDLLIDPDRRLALELSYPLGQPFAELDEWQSLLSSGAKAGELIKHSERLSTLGQSNFFAFIAAHRAAEAELLVAMIDAHGRIELSEVYEDLRDARRGSEYPAPSLANVRDILERQPDIHCQAVISAYGKIDDAAGAVFECLQQVLAKRDRRHLEFLSRLLLAYRGPAVAAQFARLQEIESVCGKIQEESDDRNLIDTLSSALDRWMFLCRPLLLVKDLAGPLGEAARTLTEQMRSLVIDLALRQLYETAIEIAELGKDRLRLVPDVKKSLDEAIVPAEQALRQLKARKLTTLKSLLEQFTVHPDPLIAAIRQDGFGPGSTGAAQRLSQVFLEAVRATRDKEFTEPWTEIRMLAKYLANQKEGKPAAARLLQGLRDQAAELAVPGWTLEALDNDLRQVTSPPSRARTRTAGRKASVYAAAALLTAACAIVLVFGFEKPRLLLTDTFARSFPLPPKATPKQETSGEKAGEETTAEQPTAEETAPLVGTGQRLSLANLRYCRFQEERLRLIKPKVRSAEDTRAFNLLAVDYNSRCSDFLYRDEDAAAVAAELKLNQERLAADADQIVAAWQGHSPPAQAAK
jgi:hypothetical protein